MRVTIAEWPMTYPASGPHSGGGIGAFAGAIVVRSRCIDSPRDPEVEAWYVKAMRLLAVALPSLLMCAACRSQSGSEPTNTDRGSSAPGAAVSLEVGSAAPDFALPGSDGQMHRLADDRGKRAVVLAWFPKAFTGG
jgi:hypothetical protein